MFMDYSEVGKIIVKYQERILTLPGVTGISTGVGRTTGKKEFCITVYCSRVVARGALANGRLPLELDGAPVEIVRTDDFVAFPR